MTKIELKFKLMSKTDSKCNTLSQLYAYGFWPRFPALSLGHLHNCCIVMSCCKFWIYWVVINAKFTTWQLSSHRSLRVNLPMLSRAWYIPKSRSNLDQNSITCNKRSLNLSIYYQHTPNVVWIYFLKHEKRTPYLCIKIIWLKFGAWFWC